MSSQVTVPADFDPENAQNIEDLEKQFAVKAVLHAQTFWNLLEKKKGSEMKLTKMDDQLLEDFIKTFPKYADPKELSNISEDEMKSPEGKKQWREFMNRYEKTLNDYNFGTLLRKSASDEYAEETTIFVPRVQFLVFEIARNRNKLNDWIYEEAHKQ
ncbi:hypothetical protein CANCADRAFT_84554 [Tortispora caseinolytica NRRL Y-17796]|uniref:Protein PBDC1 homolog n=1 Tax=Tortispora caseinolytica NRRL Y-17796 TaxID=767744 RepID=A0A1E4TKM9_9ASCO|nr:hypothetical protein CANCADRAFT_84554 [Tortispora caseinolytica NRRL Y-17796]